MSAPVDHLQERIVDAGELLADIMPSVITLAMMLRQREMAAWLRSEFEGYQRGEQLPAYRHNLSGHIVARSPQYGWIPAPIDKHQVEQFGRLDLREGIAELEQTCLNCKKGNGQRIRLPAEQLLNLQHNINLSAELAISVSRSTYCELLKTVRSTIYLWVQAVAGSGLNGEHNAFTTKERELAAGLDNPTRFWREAMTSLREVPVPNIREAGLLERIFGRTG